MSVLIQSIQAIKYISWNFTKKENNKADWFFNF